MKKYSLTLLAVLLAGQLSHAQEVARYREFPLGSDLASIVTLTGAPPSDVRAIHQRPAVMKDLEWRPRYFSRVVSRQSDPVELITFRFYDDQLFKVIVDYDRTRTEGMSEADVIAAVTADYGPVSRMLPKVSRATALVHGAAETPLAIWGDSGYSVTLARVVYSESFRLIVASTRLDALARTAGAEAVRLDASEAPQRELARRKQDADDAASAREKAKIENKAVFRP